MREGFNLRYLLVVLLVLSFVLGGEAALAADRAPGEFMIVFKPDDMVASFGKEVPEGVLNLMIDFQAGYLRARHDVEILGTFPEISRSSSRGMFHVRSKKALLSEGMFDDVMKDLRADPNIESVSENSVRRISIN